MIILTATIMQRKHGSDLVWLTTNLVEACYPYSQSLELTFHCAAGTARHYVAKHFPEVHIRVISEGI